MAPAQPVFLLDRSLGRKRIPECLRRSGWSVVTMAEHDGMPADGTVQDDEWLTQAGRHGGRRSESACLEQGGDAQDRTPGGGGTGQVSSSFDVGDAALSRLGNSWSWTVSRQDSTVRQQHVVDGGNRRRPGGAAPHDPHGALGGELAEPGPGR